MSKFTQSQKTDIARALQHRDQQLREDLRGMLLQSGNDQYAELAGRVHDRGDESVADMLSDLNYALIDRHIHELREIESARLRMADGSIDRCIACDGEIGFQRLMAYPMAVRCIHCQEQFDKTHHHETTPRL
jgi:DnaK suppressor protein